MELVLTLSPGTNALCEVATEQAASSVLLLGEGQAEARRKDLSRWFWPCWGFCILGPG